MRDLMMGHGVDSGHCSCKQQNKCSKSKTILWAVYCCLCISDETISIEEL